MRIVGKAVAEESASRLVVSENWELRSPKSFGFLAENLLCSIQLIVDTAIKSLEN